MGCRDTPIFDAARGPKFDATEPGRGRPPAQDVGNAGGRARLRRPESRRGRRARPSVDRARLPPLDPRAGRPPQPGAHEAEDGRDLRGAVPGVPAVGLPSAQRPDGKVGGDALRCGLGANAAAICVSRTAPANSQMTIITCAFPTTCISRFANCGPGWAAAACGWPSCRPSRCSSWRGPSRPASASPPPASSPSGACCTPCAGASASWAAPRSPSCARSRSWSSGSAWRWRSPPCPSPRS